MPLLMALLPLCALLIGVNAFALKIPAVRIAWYIVGAVFCVLLILLKQGDNSRNTDYIQSGEAVLGTTALIMTHHLSEAHPCLAMTAVTVLFILFEIYLHGYLQLKEHEIFYNGIFMTVFLGIIILFLWLFDPSFTGTALVRAFTPYGGDTIRDLYALPAAAAAGTALFILIKLLSPEMSLFSLGKPYFDIAGTDYTRIRLIALALKGVAVSGTFFFLGWYGGAAAFLIARLPGRATAGNAVSLLLILCYTQTLLLCSSVLTPLAPVLFAGILSWGLYVIKNRGRIMHYDRIA